MNNIGENIKLSKFFIGSLGREINYEILNNIKLHEITLPIRFRNVITYYNDNVVELITLNDLLNTDFMDLLRLKNCGISTLTDVKHIIVEYVQDLIANSLQEKSSDDKTYTIISDKQELIKQLNKTPLFIGNEGVKLESDYLYAVSLTEIDFSVRFKHCLNSIRTIKNLNDLVNTDYVNLLLLPNNGIKTIIDAREKICDYLKQKLSFNSHYETSEDIFVEDKIINEVLSLLNKDSLNVERDIETFKLYFSFDVDSSLTLEAIGKRFNITRERVRQIVERLTRIINKNPKIQLFLFKLMNEFSFFFTLDEFCNHLVDKGLLRKVNAGFMKNYVNLFLVKKKLITYEYGYFTTMNIALVDSQLLMINEFTSKQLLHEEKGIEYLHIEELLKKEFENDIFTGNAQSNRNVLKYLSFRFEDFYIVNDRIFSKMMYYISFGNTFPDVIYWSLKYLEEPIHFTQLALFIRERNKNFSNIQDVSVHSCLVRYDFCHDVDRGTYALKELNIPKHISAGEALLKLLNDRGPMLENDIKEALKDKYSSWNVTLAINNNIHKLIKIGNNLYDIRR